MDLRNDPFFEEAAPPTVPMFTHMGHENRRHGHEMSLALSPFGGMGFGGRMGMGLMPFGGPSPFSMMNGMMANMDNMMRSMQRQASVGQSFSSSSTTVMQYSSDGQGGAPRVYHASSSTRQGPGGVKETRKAVKDSHTGVQKMAVGHHIGDRSHVIERQVNAKTGEKAENQEFINLDDTDAESFGDEWREKTHSLNRASSLVLPRIEQSRRSQFSDRRGLPSTQRPQNPAHQTHVDSDDEIQVIGVEESRRGTRLAAGERDGLAARGVGVSKKRKHRVGSLSGEDATHTSTTRRSPKLSRTTSPPYVPSSQPHSHTHSIHPQSHTHTDIPPVQPNSQSRPTVVTSKQVPKKAEKKTTFAL